VGNPTTSSSSVVMVACSCICFVTEEVLINDPVSSLSNFVVPIISLYQSLQVVRLQDCYETNVPKSDMKPENDKLRKQVQDTKNRKNKE
jgi:hypothetical protein